MMPNKTFFDHRVMNFIIPIILFLAGMAILFARNPDPIINPIMLSEDGVWTGLALTKGWLYVFIHARPDYFVVINLLLLFISTKISTAVTGSPLLFLPQAVALVSYGFYAAVATFVFLTLRRVAPFIFALFGYVLIILLPLGASENEIIGRISNIGFYMPLLTVMLLFWRDQLKGKYATIFIDFSLLLCAATNPLVCALVLLYVLLDFSRDWDIGLSIKRTITLMVPFLILAAFLIPRMLANPNPGVKGGLVIANIIETTLARPLLYPFVFRGYGHLSNYGVIALTFLGAFFIWFAYRKSGNQTAKKLILYTFVALITYNLAAIVTRPGLTALLRSYHDIYPDRYFMGINALVLLLVVICIAQLSQVKPYRLFSFFLAFAILGLYIFNPYLIFEPKMPRMPISLLFNFSEQLCLSESSGKADNTSSIPIYFTGLTMIVPSRYIDKKDCKFTSYADLGVSVNDKDVYQKQASAPLGASAPIKLWMLSDHQNQNINLKRIGIMFGTYERENRGKAELQLKGPNGSTYIQRFSLPDLADNSYYYFDLTPGQYTAGEIISISGDGVSTWESRDEKGHIHTCMRYEYTDGKVRLTPGCPLYR